MCTQHWTTQIYKTNILNPKGETDSNTIIIFRDFSIPVSPIETSSRQKICKEISELHGPTRHFMDHPPAHRTLRKDHSLSHMLSVHISNTEFLPFFFSNHNGKYDKEQEG
jgi:hypothetical protein